MSELITIAQVAKELDVSYHVARNRLNRNEDCKKHKTKLGHTVVYGRKVLEILKECDR